MSFPSEIAPRLYKTASVCRLTGYSPLVLRAWERRYGLLCPVRAPSGHRLYTEDDLKVLQRTREMTQSGMTIGEVAALGRVALLQETPAEPPPKAVSLVVAPSVGTLDARGSSEIRAALVRAAMILDEGAIRASLDRLFATSDVERAMQDVVRPTLEEVGALWAAGRISVAAEKVLSQAVRSAVTARLDASARGTEANHRLVITACVEQEHHDLGALTLALAFLRRGYPALYLGPAIPLNDIDIACRLRTPLAVCLSFKLGRHLEPLRERLDLLAEAHPNVLFLVGGDGVPERDWLVPGNLQYLADADLETIVATVQRQDERVRD